MQHPLGRARWDAHRVRDDVREYVLEHLHGEDAVLVVDETGDVKKGTDTVGVQRQNTGTTGRIEHAQVAAHLVYAGGRGHAAVDRELYIPRFVDCGSGPLPGRGHGRGHRLRNQAGTGRPHDRPVPGKNLPGASPLNPLHRIAPSASAASQARYERNEAIRTRDCNENTPGAPGAGKDCDEFKDDFSVRYIDPKENQEAGRRLGAWAPGIRVTGSSTGKPSPSPSATDAPAVTPR